MNFMYVACIYKFLLKYICKKYIIAVFSLKNSHNLFLPLAQRVCSPCTPLLPQMLWTLAHRSETDSASSKNVLKKKLKNQ